MSDKTDQTSEPEGRSRTPLMLAAVAAAAVVAGLLGYFVVLPIVSPATTATTATAPTTRASAVPSAVPSATAVPEEFTGQQGRDPFKAQVSTGTVATGTSGATTAPATGTTTSTAAPAAPATPQQLDVLKVEAGSPATVTVRLDTAVHVAGAGQTIDGVLKVVGVTVQGQCATFLFGEQSFRMCAKDPARTLS
jgi:hypothetical protein